MKKTTIFIVAVILGVLSTIAVYLVYLDKKDFYRTQLEKNIDLNILEGKDEIGALNSFNVKLEADSIELIKISELKGTDKSKEFISNFLRWGPYGEYQLNLVSYVLKNGDYKYFDFTHCLTYDPFIVVVRKTEFGYDLTGEFIIGYAIKNRYPEFDIDKGRRKVISIDDGLKIKSTYENVYKVANDLIPSYVNHLIDDKYKDINIRNEVEIKENGFKVYKKFNLINELNRKVACPKDSSFNYRVNKYFELKINEDYEKMGRNSMYMHIDHYGNEYHEIIGNQVTIHYSIQENEDVLFDEYVNYLIIVLAVVELLYMVVIFLLRKRIFKNKN